MSAGPLFPRADKAAREVDPMVMAQALDHIAKTAAKSRTSTRRLRWIEQRAVFALEGREYRDIDAELPKDAGDTAQRMKFQRDMLKRVNAELLEALQPFVERNSSDEFVTITVRTADVAKARAVIAKATGSAS